MASMRTSNSNSVPPEITDHIIDYLSNDIPSLRACSLTCKLFLTRSRYHRLKTVFLEPRTAASLFKLLNDTPSVSFCIQKLVLCRNRIPRPRPPITFRKELGWVSSVAHILSHLTRLEVEGFSVAGALAKILTNNFKNVGQLTLIRCSFPAMDHLFYLYSSFPNLNDLRMSDTFLKPTLGLPGAEETGPEDNVKSVAVDNLAPPLLTTLAFPSRINFVQDSVEMRFIAWIMKQSLHKNLRTLKMYDVSPTERTLIQQLITKLGPGLQRLSIGLSEMFDQGAMGPLLDLSASTGLKNLSLCSLKLRRYDHAGGRDLIGHLPPHEYIDWFKMILPPNTFYPLGWVPASLSTLRTSKVTNIRFRFHAGGTCGRDWLALDWAKLVEVLSKHQLFPGLKRATFDVLTGASSQGLILCFIARRVAALKEDKELRFIERRSGV